jgi:large subunit ribosomal protein L5
MAKEDKNQDGGTATMTPSRLRTKFREEISGKAGEKFDLKNKLARPKMEKIVVNVNMGRHLDGAKIPPNVRDTIIDTLTTISGQKPIVIKAKKSVANFKVREGMPTAAMVTLRRDRMWHFLDRLINLATPRIKDFRGLPTKSFDQAGNYSMGLQEQAVWPEIDMAQVSFTHGMHINICFSNSDPEKSRFILEELGMPFAKEDN